MQPQIKFLIQTAVNGVVVKSHEIIAIPENGVASIYKNYPAFGALSPYGVLVLEQGNPETGKALSTGPQLMFFNERNPSKTTGLRN